ncbi:MAG: universal stress protein, partial [Rhizobium sp.]|nr:universal stress protein [Rhizobium sp.]
MYKKIVVPVDCGALDKGEKILRKAAQLLDAGGEIILMTVIEDMPGYITIELPVNAIED